MTIGLYPFRANKYALAIPAGPKPTTIGLCSSFNSPYVGALYTKGSTLLALFFNFLR